MKVLKAYIEIEHPSPTSTNYIGYPQLWLDNATRIPLVLTPNDRSDEVVHNGKLCQILYPVVPDDLLDQFLAIDGITLADPNELEAYSDKHTPRTESITHERVFNKIMLKFMRGEPLSKKDRDALDPTNPEPGVTMSKSFTDLADEYGATNLKKNK